MIQNNLPAAINGLKYKTENSAHRSARACIAVQVPVPRCRNNVRIHRMKRKT